MATEPIGSRPAVITPAIGHTTITTTPQGVGLARSMLETATPGTTESKGFCSQVGLCFKSIADTLRNALFKAMNWIRSFFPKAEGPVQFQPSQTPPVAPPQAQPLTPQTPPAATPQPLTPQTPPAAASQPQPQPLQTPPPAANSQVQAQPPQASSIRVTAPPQRESLFEALPRLREERDAQLGEMDQGREAQRREHQEAAADRRGRREARLEKIYQGIEASRAMAKPEIQRRTGVAEASGRAAVPEVLQRESGDERRARIEGTWSDTYSQARAPLTRAENYLDRVKGQAIDFFQGLKGQVGSGASHDEVDRQIGGFLSQLDDQWKKEAREGEYLSDPRRESIFFDKTRTLFSQKFQGDARTLFLQKCQRTDSLVECVKGLDVKTLASNATAPERSMLENKKDNLNLSELLAERDLSRQPCWPQLQGSRNQECRDQVIRAELMIRAFQGTSFLGAEPPGESLLRRMQTSRNWVEQKDLENALRKGQARSEAFQREIQLRQGDLEKIGPVRSVVLSQLLTDLEMLENILESEQQVNTALQREIEAVKREAEAVKREMTS